MPIPGPALFEAAHRAGVRVVPIPGPSAVATALSISGFSADEFVFMGFPPRSGKAREDWLRRLNGDPRVVVFFEAPHRIARTIADMSATTVKRPIILIKEITKIHETLVNISSVPSDWLPPTKGELTLVVGPLEYEKFDNGPNVDIVDIFGRLTDRAGLSEELALQYHRQNLQCGSIGCSEGHEKIFHIGQTTERQPGLTVLSAFCYRSEGFLPAGKRV